MASTPDAPVSVARATHTTVTKCTFTPGTDICAGVLASDFYHKPDPIKALRTGAGALARSKEHPRQVKCNLPISQKCPSSQYATTFVSKDARRFPGLEHLLPQTAIVVGAIRLSSNSKADRRYEVGEDLEFSPEGRRLIMVAFPLPTPPASPPPDNTPVARWTLFRLSGIGTTHAKIDSLRSGTIVNCKYAHPGDDPEKPESFFAPCKAEPIYRAIAALAKISLHKAFDVPSCAPGKCSKSAAKKVAAFRMLVDRSARQQFDSLRAALLTQAIDPSTDVYWFTCASGCCTADM